MPFETEHTGYAKTALSELQGAWSLLRDSVVKHFGFPDSDRLLFQIDEAMSWESVRDLNHMKKILTLVTNIANQTDTPEEIMEWLGDVQSTYDATIIAIAEGRAK